MEKYLKAIQKCLPVLSVILFCIITLSIMMIHGFTPSEDTAHAWTIAGNTTIHQLIDLMNIEGHFLIWYLLIRPFAKFNLLYPYPMFFINWIITIIAVVILWKKAPFNNFIKFLITFSSPIMNLYAVQPRCYGVGIALLFGALSIYNEKLKHPYIYLTFLVLAANTSAPMCIASGILGLMFLYDYFRENKDIWNKNHNIFIIVTASVVILNLILFYFQFHNISMPNYEKTSVIKAPYYVAAYLGLKNDLPLTDLLKMIPLWIGTIIFPIAFFRNKHALTFFVFSEIITLLFFTFVYEARVHHVCMLYIFAIAAYWIFCLDTNIKSRLMHISFVILLIFMIMLPVQYKLPQYGTVLDEIVADKNLNTSRLYTNIPLISLSPAIPVINKIGTTFYDMNGVDLSSYEGLKIYFAPKKQVNPDSFASILDKNKENYIILQGYFSENKIFGKKYSFEVDLYEIIPFKNKFNGIYVYKVKNINMY